LLWNGGYGTTAGDNGATEFLRKQSNPTALTEWWKRGNRSDISCSLSEFFSVGVQAETADANEMKVHCV